MNMQILLCIIRHFVCTTVTIFDKFHSLSAFLTPIGYIKKQVVFSIQFYVHTNVYRSSIRVETNCTQVPIVFLGNHDQTTLIVVCGQCP